MGLTPQALAIILICVGVLIAIGGLVVQFVLPKLKQPNLKSVDASTVTAFEQHNERSAELFEAVVAENKALKSELDAIRAVVGVKPAQETTA